MEYGEIFKNCGDVYDFDTYRENADLNNEQSLNYFLEFIAQVPIESIVENYGTQAIIRHPDYNFLVVLDSCGRGDFYSHRIEISRYND